MIPATEINYNISYSAIKMDTKFQVTVLSFSSNESLFKKNIQIFTPVMIVRAGKERLH